MNAPVPAKKKNERSASQNSPSEARVAYPYFHEKRTKNAAGQPFVFPSGHEKAGQPNPRHSGTFMFPKLNADPYQCANYMWLWGLAVEAAQKMWPQNVDQSGKWIWPQGAQYGVKDGDVPFVPKAKPGQPAPNPEEIAKKNAWRRGYWIVEAEHFLDPGPRVCKIVNGIVTDIPAKSINGVEQYKSGDFGFPNLHAWAYENSTFGVNFGFDGFLFTREGERIGNSSGPKSAAQMFANVAGMAATLAPAAPIAGPGPTMAAPGPQPSSMPNVAAGGMINALNNMAPPPAPGPMAPAPQAPTYTAPGAPPLPPPSPATLAPQFPGQLNPPLATAPQQYAPPLVAGAPGYAQPGAPLAPPSPPAPPASASTFHSSAPPPPGLPPLPVR